jgi:drug/metabolite transporter (DMT)-like permease
MSVHRNLKFGLICMAGYVLFFVVSNMITKMLAKSLPLAEIAFFRYAVAIPTILMLLAAAPGASLRVNRAFVHVVRGLLAAAGSLCGYFAIAVIPLGDATFYIGPLVVTAGAALFLRERPGPIRLLCVLTGFCGVLMIAQPHAADAAGILAGAGNALCAASGVLLVRAVRNSEDALSLAATTSVVCAIVLAPLAASSWSPVSWMNLMALAALGVTGALATVLINTAYQSAPAAPLATIDFLAVRRASLQAPRSWPTCPRGRQLPAASSLSRRESPAPHAEMCHGLPEGSDESARCFR